MKLAPLKLLLASLALSSFVVAGCAADPSSVSEDDEVEDTEVSQDELSSRARQFVGNYSWDAASSGGFVDFETLDLKASGAYSAKVDSGLVNPAVRCIRFPCTLPEAGSWTTVKVGGKLKIRVNPYGVKPARSYYASISNGVLTLTRFGQTTKLFKASTLTCANVRCAAGTHCEMKGINGGVVPACIADEPAPPSCAAMLCMAGTNCIDTPTGGQCVPIATCAATLCGPGTTCTDTPTGAKCVPVAQPACVKTGCSGQICADDHRISTCEFRPEYACYATATCERQANGACGWTPTPALTSCLASH